MAANMLGKIKTWAQIVAISLLLLHNIIFEMISFPFDILLFGLLYSLLFGQDWIILLKINNLS